MKALSSLELNRGDVGIILCMSGTYQTRQCGGLNVVGKHDCSRTRAPNTSVNLSQHEELLLHHVHRSRTFDDTVVYLLSVEVTG
jgi:hypothetical protein